MQKEDLIERYGPMMSINDLAEFFGMSKGAIYNKLSKDTFEVPTFKMGGRLVAETADVVQFVNESKLLKK